jgi:hypothetical protein
MTAGPDSAPSESPAASEPRPASLLLVVLLTLVAPGAGHLYLGRWGAGAAWMIVGIAVYLNSLWAGLVLHGLCLLSLVLRRPR